MWISAAERLSSSSKISFEVVMLAVSPAARRSAVVACRRHGKNRAVSLAPLSAFSSMAMLTNSERLSPGCSCNSQHALPSSRRAGAGVRSMMVRNSRPSRAS